MLAKETSITRKDITLQINSEWLCIPYIILAQIACVTALLRLTDMSEHERAQFFSDNLSMDMLNDISECLLLHAGDQQVQSLYKVCKLDYDETKETKAAREEENFTKSATTAARAA